MTVHFVNNNKYLGWLHRSVGVAAVVDVIYGFRKCNKKSEKLNFLIAKNPGKYVIKLWQIYAIFRNILLHINIQK